MFSKEVLIDSLTVVKDRALLGSVMWEFLGICANWQEELGSSFSYILVETLSSGWEHHTGIMHLPIRDNEDLWCWESDNLALRLSLIDHILKRLEEVDQGWLDELYEEVYSE